MALNWKCFLFYLSVSPSSLLFVVVFLSIFLSLCSSLFSSSAFLSLCLVCFHLLSFYLSALFVFIFYISIFLILLVFIFCVSIHLLSAALPHEVKVGATLEQRTFLKYSTNGDDDRYEIDEKQNPKNARGLFQNHRNLNFVYSDWRNYTLFGDCLVLVAVYKFQKYPIMYRDVCKVCINFDNVRKVRKCA
jgi:hypothetical protein